jgi:predicted phosphodiesterase
MGHFRFLHISDLHLAEEADHLNRHDKIREIFSGGTDVSLAEYPINVLKKLVKPTTYSSFAQFMTAKFCYDCRDDVDAIVLTGDIATTGREKDLRAASDFVLRNTKTHFYKWDQSTSLSAGGRSVFVMPGNHDRYKTYVPVPAPNCLNFENYFPDHYPLGKRVYSRTRSKPDGSRVGLVFGDFCIQDQADVDTVSQLWGGGVVYTDILDEMEVETQRLRTKFPGIFVVWAIHFAPFECGKALELIDGSMILDRARQINVKYILCGHTHDQEKVPIRGVTVYCAGSACSMDRDGRHTAHIIDIKHDGRNTLVSRENFLLSSTSGGFKRGPDD